MGQINDSGFVRPLDIKSPGFFWMLRPWKEGKLATIDGWGRFSEISFSDKNRMSIRYLVNFPRMTLDRSLDVWPDQDILIAQSGKMYHIADIGTKKTKSLIPFLTWVANGLRPVMVDSSEKLINFQYYSNLDDSMRSFIYNVAEDKMVYEMPEEGHEVDMMYPITGDILLSSEYLYGDDGKRNSIYYYFYNWRTGEKTENELTRRLSTLDIGVLALEDFRNVNLQKRFLFAYDYNISGRIRIDWNEDYEGITDMPLALYIPENTSLKDLILSPDGMWGEAFVSGFRGIKGVSLSRRGFFHFGGQYPGGMSEVVLSEDYEVYEFDYGAFVNHPEYGMCFAKEHYKYENGKDQLYLRLYKMNDVLDGINRRLLEKAEGVVNG
jgi:hypothetical protein